jgi:hypothetical protein
LHRWVSGVAQSEAVPWFGLCAKDNHVFGPSRKRAKISQVATEHGAPWFGHGNDQGVDRRPAAG